MRPLIPIAALVLAGCAAEPEPQPPPSNRFVYPTGIVHRDVPGAPEGALYVASANFDKCFDTGAVTALDLDALGLPPIGEVAPGEEPLEILDLQVSTDAYLQIESFAGEMALWTPSDGRAPRLFVPTRAENNYLHAIDIVGKTELQCAQEGGARNCILGALSLSAGVEGQVDGLPRAPAPLGVTVAMNAENAPEVWVTHVEAADSPIGTSRNLKTYVVRVPGDELSVSAADFIPLTGLSLENGGAHATAIGSRYVYASGRNYVAADVTQPASFLLRLIDRDDTTRVLDADLRSIYFTLEARDLALGASPGPSTERLYIAARFPDTLLVVDVTNSESQRPGVSVVDSVPLPDGANQLAVIPRPGMADLVAVTGTTAGVVALYDAALGQIVAQVGDVGRQPYGITVDNRGTAARLYVSNFGDGQIAVIDIPNLAAAQDARLVARLGARQGRDERRGTSTCTPEGEP